MKLFQCLPMGAALLSLGLGISAAVPAPASARDEGSGTRADRGFIWVAQDDRDSERDSDSGYLGVQVQRLTPSLRRAKGIPGSTEGTLVNSVEDGSPADNAGIKRGDVILEVNRRETPGPGDLVRIVRSLDPGRKVPVKVWRDGATRTYTLTVGARPAGSDMPMTPPGWGRDGRDTPPMPPDGPRMQIFRRTRDDLQKQVDDLKEQCAKMEAEIRELQQQLDRRDNDRGRHDDRDQDNDEGD